MKINMYWKLTWIVCGKRPYRRRGDPATTPLSRWYLVWFFFQLHRTNPAWMLYKATNGSKSPAEAPCNSSSSSSCAVAPGSITHYGVVDAWRLAAAAAAAPPALQTTTCDVRLLLPPPVSSELDHRFLPKAAMLVSSYIGTREGFVSYTRNSFSIFYSLSSRNLLPHQQSA